MLKKGNDVTLIATGALVHIALKAAKLLEDKGISTRVLNIHTIKPIDEIAVINEARIAGAIVTVEDHQIAGGLGSAVSELLSQGHPVPIELIGMRDSFGESGTPEELWEKYGLKAKNIIEAVKKMRLTRVAEQITQYRYLQEEIDVDGKRDKNQYEKEISRLIKLRMYIDGMKI